MGRIVLARKKGTCKRKIVLLAWEQPCKDGRVGQLSCDLAEKKNEDGKEPAQLLDCIAEAPKHPLVTGKSVHMSHLAHPCSALTVLPTGPKSASQ